jgi:D-beta-D-heptose 7-phosphate kinase / D-beta-D-heptose 1-phosphate adenosyltransferase
MTRLTVVGDTFLDVDVHGTTTRLCPEAPAPVVDMKVARVRPGGAGLAATLAAQSGAQVVLVTPLVEDEAGSRLRDALERSGVQVVQLPADGRTEVKQRIIADGAVVARIDRGRVDFDEHAPISPAARQAILEDCDALLVSDYGRGVAAHADLRFTLEQGATRVPLTWDPHTRGSAPVTGTRIVTPNRHEAHEWAHRLGRRGSSTPHADGTAPDLSAVIEDARVLGARWPVGVVAVTLGAQGVLIHFGDGAPLVIPARTRVQADSCGAGDAFAGALAIASAEGSVVSEAAAIACTASGSFLASGGVRALHSKDRHNGEAKASASLPEIVQATRQRGGRVVATGGCFDLMHAGHVETLHSARALGDCLVVLLNSDRSVRSLKGADRPLQSAVDRRKVLEALADVDAVILFNERTPERALRELQPDVWVKGGDYTGTEMVEEKVVASWGGATVTVPYLPGRSTSSLVARAGITPNGILEDSR